VFLLNETNGIFAPNKFSNHISKHFSQHFYEIARFARVLQLKNYYHEKI